MNRIASRLVFLFLLVFGGYAQSAYAQNCNTPVVDAAGIFGSDIGRVESAVQGLQNLGAEVRIRTYKRGENLDVIEKRLENQCLTWQSADGGRKNNLIVMMISIEDRQFGFYAGEQWRSTLEPYYTSIENDHMIPRFRDKDFAGGFVAGLERMTRLVDAKVNVSVETVPPQVIIERPVVVGEPADLSGLWSVLGWLVGLVALGAALFGLYWFVKVRAQERERRRAAQQKAVLAKQTAASRINSISQNMPLLEAQVSSLASNVSAEDGAAFEATLETIQKIAGPATESYADLDNTASDPSREGLTVQEYDQIDSAYQIRVIDPVVEAERMMKSAEEEMTKLQAVMAELPGRVNETRDLVGAKAPREINKVRELGYRTNESDRLVADANNLLELSVADLGLKRFNSARVNVEKAGKAAVDAVSLAQGLPARRSRIATRRDELQSRTGAVTASIKTGSEVFIRISLNFAESSWESVRGNGTEAEERLDWSIESLKTVETLADMKHQEWAEAEETLQEIEKSLNEADSMMRSIVALETNLHKAKNDAPSELNAAESDIGKAWKYISEYDDDIPESFEDELQEAEALLGSAKEELGKNKPDYLQVVKSAQSANSFADKILDKSRTEHEKAERLRQKAVSLMRDANSEYSKAKEYIEDHSGDVESPAKESLSQAHRYLVGLGNAGTTEKQIEVAETAERLAKEAYAKAKKDVDDAEEERARRRRAAVQTAARAVSYSSSSSHRSSRPSRPSGGSFGGSRNFGSSGRGFGGSRSW